MPRFRLPSIDYLHCFAFMAVWVVAMTLTGCDTPAQFQAKHSQEAVVIEDVVEFAEKLAEGTAEQVLKLPDGSLQMIFNHKVFIVPAAVVNHAEVVGVPIPAETATK